MKLTSCLSAAALIMGMTAGGFSEAVAQPYDYVYWPFFYHARPVPPRVAARPLPAPPRRATVAYNTIRPLTTYSPALIFGVGY